MKTLLIFAGLAAFFLLAAPPDTKAQARTRTIIGKIKSFECGDNCYLTVTDRQGRDHDGLCTAAACQSWNEKTVMPKRFRGRRVRVTVGRGTQVDGSGNTMGKMDAFKRIVFL